MHHVALNLELITLKYGRLKTRRTEHNNARCTRAQPPRLYHGTQGAGEGDVTTHYYLEANKKHISYRKGLFSYKIYSKHKLCMQVIVKFDRLHPVVC
jgi:hypothetical protein